MQRVSTTGTSLSPFVFALFLLGTVRLPALPQPARPPAAPPRGLVKDASTGKAVAAARIAVRWPPGGGETLSDEEGLFSLTAGAEEPLRVEIAAEGYAEDVVEVPPAAVGAEEPFPVALSRGGTLRVQAWDERGDGPCQGCEVWVRPKTPRLKRVQLVTDARGAATSELLAPGVYDVGLVTADSEGHMVRVSSGGDRRTVQVASDAEAVVVLGEGRTPLEIVLEPAAPPGMSIYAEGAKGFQALHAGPDGTFVLRRSPGDAYALTLTDGAGTRTRVGSVPEDYAQPVLPLTLGAGRISGRLVEEGQPLGGEPVAVSRAGESAPTASTRTGEDGGFALPFLTPGTYLLQHRGQALRSVLLGSDPTSGELGLIDLSPDPQSSATGERPGESGPLAQEKATAQEEAARAAHLSGRALRGRRAVTVRAGLVW